MLTPLARRSFEDVLEAELNEITKSRGFRNGAQCEVSPATDAHSVHERACGSQLVGLAFSGGGIRSATFNLGVLQGLADLGLLSRIDYLSTVSGGGYIGSWLAAWISRSCLGNVEENLRTDQAEEPRQIQFLREYSNYLTPKLGFLSGDTWAFVGSYLRNLSLNLTILVLALIALLLLVRPVVLYFWLIAASNPPSTAWLVVALISLALGLAYTIANLSNVMEALPRSRLKQRADKPVQVYLLVLVCILMGGWFLWAWGWASYPHLPSNWTLSLQAGAVYAAIWALGWSLGAIAKWFNQQLGEQPPAPPTEEATPKTSVAPSLIWVIAAAAVSGGIAVLLLFVMDKFLHDWANKTPPLPAWHIAYLGVPLVVMAFLIAETLHIGLVGDIFSEDAREGWGRLGGMLLLWTLLLTALFAVAIDGPWLLGWLGKQSWVRTGWIKGSWIKWALTAMWAALTGAGVMAGKSRATDLRNPKGTLELIGKIAPPAFVTGLLLILAFSINEILPPMINDIHAVFGESTIHRILGAWHESAPPNPDLYWNKFAATMDGCLLICVAVLLLAAWLLSRRVGINTFSMHAMYRNRLVRCYLGASNLDRNQQAFTGFDPRDDDIRLADLLAARNYTGPYPIMNTALNLVGGETLAWQERKAASFMFTPGCCGYEFTTPDGSSVKALRPTQESGSPIHLGMSMATSGAAASPNMGYHTSPALSFLMTVFNVRLGWWMNNPNYAPVWKTPGQHLGLFYLFCELLGMTNYRRNFVYLSDGGHFENLGIYELVRRRCRFIVACDASEDKDMKFGDLGNAIEKCRTDFGINIEINIEPLRCLKDTNKSHWHCAIGKIHYEGVHENALPGTLVYLKASMTGDEPTDVQRYAAQNTSFPHQSTADQWFDESQFESYRALGHHVATSVFSAVGNRAELTSKPTEEFFVQLRRRWYPPSPAISAAFTKHTATYTKLLERMRNDSRLKFLDAQFYPEWPKLTEGSVNSPGPSTAWLPATYEERRAGFYICNEIIQLMEDAYLDLNLEEEYNHPDNRGWMNLFRHWTWSGMFCATWAVSAGIYGARFQRFCERHLDLHFGKFGIAGPADGPLCLSNDQMQHDNVFQTAEQQRLLNFWEVQLIRTFLQRPREAGEPLVPFPLRIVPFEMVVNSPQGGDVLIRFTFGFALVHHDNRETRRDGAQIWFFRIQNHLRNAGLAREALRVLLEEYDYHVENRIEKSRHDSDRPPGAFSEAEALPNADAVREFKQLFDSLRFGTDRSGTRRASGKRLGLYLTAGQGGPSP